MESGSGVDHTSQIGVEGETDSLLDKVVVSSNVTMEEEEECGSSDDDDDDDDTLSTADGGFWNDLITASWRDHSVAIAIAVVATLVAYFVQRIHNMSEIVDQPSFGRHLVEVDYPRTANLSFCGDDTLFELRRVVDGKKNLELMEFRIPQEFERTLRILYELDGRQVPSCLADTDTIVTPTASSRSNSDIIGTTGFYKSPSVQSMYPHLSPQTQPVQAAHLSFTGFAAQFFNLSPEPLLLYWDDRGERSLVGEIRALSSLTTATFSGESFSVSPVFDSSTALQRWVVTLDNAVHYYKPQDSRTLDKIYADENLAFRYELALLNKAFALEYLVASRRTWLSQFPRPHMQSPMRPASYLGQQHTVKHVENERKVLMQLQAVSVSPRVFTVDNFLTPEECQALLSAVGSTFQPSTVYAGDHRRQLAARSSSTAWISKPSNLTASIYNRAAKLLNMNDLSHRVESLQVVQYNTSQHYAPHHDWILPDMAASHQPTRFATLLIYLNDDYEGGQTWFPRAVTSEFHDGIEVTPATGKAVLFYNVLPDGNVDDASQHGSKVVTEGTKYVANLWVWEPYVV